MTRYCTFLLALALWFAASLDSWADEVCASCGYQVTISGSFSHHKDRTNMVIEGAGENAAAYREDVNGTNFTVIISHLPAGRYMVTIGAAETVVGAPGERVFDVSEGDRVLAKDFDIFSNAAGARKVAAITGTIEKEDDALRGPLSVTFVGSKGAAKFNRFEVKDSSGGSVVAFQASELADAFTAAAMRVPDV